MPLSKSSSAAGPKGYRLDNRRSHQQSHLLSAVGWPCSPYSPTAKSPSNSLPCNSPDICSRQVDYRPTRYLAIGCTHTTRQAATRLIECCFGTAHRSSSAKSTLGWRAIAMLEFSSDGKRHVSWWELCGQTGAEGREDRRGRSLDRAAR